ncbi:MAG: phosphatidate cytidylyltransferase [Deltaproteobacteria bacterium]|nr:phosphatidate cytidylyltransferase [Candidatus Anaeroferrophillus wilburensis]MBN2889331.1 phosphatidate cytidylyltransferase [Deltaproteobacteria bacterium]
MTPFWKRYICTSRVYSGLVFVPLFIVILALAPKWLFFLLCIVALMIAFQEGWDLLCRDQERWSRWTAGTGAVAMAAAACWGDPGLLAGFLLLVFLAAVAQMFRQEMGKPALASLGSQLLLFFYLPFLFSHLLLLWDLAGGRALVAMVFLATWGGDAFSYYTGTAWGRHKLAPQISPNKSIEGCLGGIAGAGLFSLLLAMAGLVPLSWYGLVILGIIANLAGQLGDLFESYLKRLAGIKDSGKLIPGHGGLLDRVDSVLFAAPVIYYGALVLMR